MARRRARNARPRRLPLAIGLTLILAGLITVAANAAEGYGLFDRLIAGAALTTARDKAARALRESWPGLALIVAGGSIVLLGRARRGR